jgi:hypothetical protein
MFLKILILSVILVAFTMLALGVKLLFNKEATFTGHACSLENGKQNGIGGCAGCGIQEVTNCPEKEE